MEVKGEQISKRPRGVKPVLQVQIVNYLPPNPNPKYILLELHKLKLSLIYPRKQRKSGGGGEALALQLLFSYLSENPLPKCEKKSGHQVNLHQVLFITCKSLSWLTNGSVQITVDPRQRRQKDSDVLLGFNAKMRE